MPGGERRGSLYPAVQCHHQNGSTLRQAAMWAIFWEMPGIEERGSPYPTLSPSEWLCIKMGSSLSYLAVSLIVEGKVATRFHRPHPREKKDKLKQTLLLLRSTGCGQICGGCCELDCHAEVVCGPPELGVEVCLIVPLVVKEWAGLEHAYWRMIVISTVTACSVCLPDPL